MSKSVVYGFMALVMSALNCLAAADPPRTAPSFSVNSYDSAVHRVGTQGPAQIEVRDQALINLPKGFIFIPEQPAREFMRALGNDTSNDFAGLILPEKQDRWFISVEYVASGHVRDDDAKTWNMGQLLNVAQQKTETGNAQRLTLGLPALDVIGWVEKPQYDANSHQLIFSISVRARGNSDNSKNGVNYKTVLLGREGYIRLTMVTTLADVEAQKAIVHSILSKVSFVAGKRYGDFNAATDKSADYGLNALIAGLPAQKPGLWSVMTGFLMLFVKIAIGLSVIGVLALRVVMRRRQKAAEFAAAVKADREARSARQAVRDKLPL